MIPSTPFKIVLILLFATVLNACGRGGDASSDQPPVVTVYSERAEHLIQPLFARYTEKTGVQIRYITDNASSLIQRLRSEGGNTRADLLLTVDVGNLWQAQQAEVLQPIQSGVLTGNIPAHLRAPDGSWYGLSVRARAIVYATDRLTPEEMSSYEDLADPRWQGRLCLRTSKKVYNQSLVASMIESLGEARTEEVVRGWVANLAADPYANDTSVMEAIMAGQCDLGVVNTYYFGRLQRANPDIPLALFWPNQGDRGVHINVSGGGVTRHAPNPTAAQALLEWLSSPDAQGQFAELNQEYPANPSVASSEEVASWGNFIADPMNVEAAGRLQPDAIRLMDRAGYR